MSIRTQILLCLAITMAATVHSQTIDEQWGEYTLAKHDTNQVKILLDIGYALEAEMPDSALSVYRMAIRKSLQANYPVGAGRALMYSGIVHSNSGDHDSSFYNYSLALKQFEKARYQTGIASTYVNRGVLHNYHGDYQLAMEDYLAGIRIYEEENDSYRLLSCYGNVGGIFVELQQFEKGQEYFKKELNLAIELNDSSMMADAYNNLGFSFQTLQLADSAMHYYLLAYRLAAKQKSDYLQFLCNNNIADLLASLGRVEEALPYAMESIRFAKTLGNPYNVFGAYKNLGARHLELEQYEIADLYLDSAIFIGKQIGAKDMLADAYLFQSENKAKQQNFEKAYELQHLHKMYADSVFKEEQLQQLNEFEIAYESEKKDRNIAEQELILERNQKESQLMAAGVAALLVVILFILIYFRQKQKLKNEKLLAMQKEKEVAVVRSMMDGEEHERLRIARGLHDGLSAMLAGVKMKFSTVKTVDELEPAIESLDKASKEVRRIAHNMMPEVLLNYGLEAAIKEFTESLNQDDGFQIDLQLVNIHLKLDSSSQLMIYRIVQELLNNVIKHAKAKNVLVQVSQFNNTLSLTVEDDGVGFDLEKALAKKSIGLSNLQARVEFLNGTLSIDSSKEKGTSTYIELHNLDSSEKD